MKPRLSPLRGLFSLPEFRRLSCFLLAAACLTVAGCASPPLDAARASYYAGQAEAANQDLSRVPVQHKDVVLYLMERGMIRQSRGDYEGSTRDWLAAIARERELETYSLSRGSASLLVNDRTLAYRGYPFERTLLHTFLAKNYLVRGLWDDAAVEARNIIRQQESLNGYPGDAYSRYMAGFCLEMTGDADNAALQYRLAAALAPTVPLDPLTGRFAAGAPAVPRAAELVCFLSIGHVCAGPDVAEPAVALYADGRYLGPAFVLANVGSIAQQSAQRAAALQAAKMVTRIALKETLASAVGHENQALGDLLRLLLFSFEQPDTRRWETLPQWLAVGRVPCPEKLTEFEAVFTAGPARAGVSVPVRGPFAQRGRTSVAFCRDIRFTTTQSPSAP